MSGEQQRIVADERAADERYRNALRRRLKVPVAVSRDSGVRKPPSATAPAEKGLIGRVALAEPTDFFDGTDFYIGSGYSDEPQLIVFSWAAPIASTFFRGRGTHQLCDRVTATRTLLRRRGQIDDYIDDDGPAPATHPPFAARVLAVPQAPTRRRLPGSASSGQAAVPSTNRGTDAVPEPRAGGIRAERAVRAAIGAPRRSRLSSVLATLQPEQYDLITADTDGTLIVQGPPGTGKTVVAAHRAAYLAHREHGPKRQRVLVVGPTEHYRHHIKGVLTDLVEDAGTVESTSLTEILAELAKLPEPVDDGLSANDRDANAHLAELAERAANLLRTGDRGRPLSSHADHVAAVYEALRTNRASRYPVTREAVWARYLRALPDLRTARRMRRHLALLAACNLVVVEHNHTRYDHVVVDEAQDITPLEWAVLKRVNPDGGWTVLGDMSQRRGDWSCPSWSHVAEELGASKPRVEALRRGYRTSAEIMRFAERLLPRLDRKVDPLQVSGRPPRLVRVRPTEVTARVAQEAGDLLERHRDGTVAVIAMSPADAVRALRRLGFTVDPHDRSKLIRQAAAVRVLDPQQARGLEFDAVLVVEPAAFPTRSGQHGLLYTSLTRANRELVLVHSEPLPRELRPSPPMRPTTIPFPRSSRAGIFQNEACEP